MKIPPNKLYSTEHIELLSTIGQGTVCSLILVLYSFMIMYTGVSGLVYKAYVNMGGQRDVVAIKTGKGNKYMKDNSNSESNNGV